MKRKPLLIFMFLLPIMFQVAKCYSSSDIAISAEPYNWSKEMRTLKIVPEDFKLIAKITIINEDSSEPILINELRLELKIEKEGKGSAYPYFMILNSLYLPPKEEVTVFMPIEIYRHEFGYEKLGEYSVTITYEINGKSPKEIEPFNPFTFRVLSKQQFEKEIEEGKTAFIYIGPFKFTLIEISMNSTIAITIVGVVLGILLRKKRKKRD